MISEILSRFSSVKAGLVVSRPHSYRVLGGYSEVGGGSSRSEFSNALSSNGGPAARFERLQQPHVVTGILQDDVRYHVPPWPCASFT